MRHYEALSRLRTETGEIINAAEFMPQAESAGLAAKIDSRAVFRCVQIVRRLLMKNREIGLFCNLSATTLANSAVFPQLVEFLEANRAIASSLTLEFKHSAWRAMGPIEHEALAAFTQRGFRLSLDNVEDLRIDPRSLAERGFKFIKVPGSLLLNRAGIALATDIHPSDLSDLLARSGIDLVADKIESEATVVDLLDCNVRYGQGHLFSPPRPVRADALQTADERSDPAGGDRAGEKSEQPAKGTGGSGTQPKSPAGTGAGTRIGLSQLATSVAERL